MLYQNIVSYQMYYCCLVYLCNPCYHLINIHVCKQLLVLLQTHRLSLFPFCINLSIYLVYIYKYYRVFQMLINNNPKSYYKAACNYIYVKLLTELCAQISMLYTLTYYMYMQIDKYLMQRRLDSYQTFLTGHALIYLFFVCSN